VRPLPRSCGRLGRGAAHRCVIRRPPGTASSRWPRRSTDLALGCGRPAERAINGRYRLSVGQVTARPLIVADSASEIDGRLRMID
jgi:hypothetical protein